MLGLFLILAVTLSEEASLTMGKKAVHDHLETPLAMGFFSYIWGILFFAILVLLGADFKFDWQSLPFLLVRLVFEIAFLHVTVKAVLAAERTTFAFLRLMTIPLLLIVDVMVGYQISSLQFAGIALLLMALLLLFYRNPSGRKGTGTVLLSAVLAVATTSLFKYDITKYNSVAAEQLITLSIVTIYFYLLSRFVSHEHPIRMLTQKVTGTQALLRGVGITLQSYAIALLAPSVMMALKRALSAGWSIIFGRIYFRESNLARKILAFMIVGVGITLTAISI